MQYFLLFLYNDGGTDMYTLFKADGSEPVRYGSRPDWPWKEMEVGDRIVLDVGDMGRPNAKTTVTVHAYASKANKRFKTKTINNQLNVWRVA
jgi:hypothetical protein